MTTMLVHRPSSRSSLTSPKESARLLGAFMTSASTRCP